MQKVQLQYLIMRSEEHLKKGEHHLSELKWHIMKCKELLATLNKELEKK